MESLEKRDLPIIHPKSRGFERQKRFYLLEKAKSLSYCTNWMKEFTNIKV
ncbi:MAG: hypothetical protein QW745_07520 [Thermoplasmata archaeon]